MAQINLDTAQRLDITCRKGDTFLLEVDFGQTIPTDGWLMQVRLSDVDDEFVLEASSASEIVVSDGNATGATITDSKITVTIAADIMDEPTLSGMYVYDIQNTDNGVVKTYLYGIFKVNEDITIVE
jgi:hypothetical protein